jgi:DNA-binding cell septation regulator SpoVG
MYKKAKKDKQVKNIKIRDIQIVPIHPQNGLVAFASAVINDQLYIGNIAIYTSPSSPQGFRLVYPSRNLKSGTKIKIVYPINKESGFLIQETIVKEYQKLIEKLTKGANKNEKQPGSAEKLCNGEV